MPLFKLALVITDQRIKTYLNNTFQIFQYCLPCAICCIKRVEVSCPIAWDIQVLVYWGINDRLAEKHEHHLRAPLDRGSFCRSLFSDFRDKSVPRDKLEVVLVPFLSAEKWKGYFWYNRRGLFCSWNNYFLWLKIFTRQRSYFNYLVLVKKDKLVHGLEDCFCDNSQLLYHNSTSLSLANSN